MKAVCEKHYLAYDVEAGCPDCVVLPKSEPTPEFQGAPAEPCIWPDWPLTENYLKLVTEPNLSPSWPVDYYGVKI